MKRTFKTLGLFMSVLFLLTACSSDDEGGGIVGSWRTTYVDNGGYNISISYTFNENGRYSSSASYRGEGLPFMQLETKGKYTFSGTSLQISEEEYNYYSDDTGGSTGKYNDASAILTFPAAVSGSSLRLSDYKLSALYIGEISFKRD